MSLAARRPEAADGFQHEALFYSGRHQFLAGTVRFVRQGLDGGEAVLVTLPRLHLDLLREALGRDSGGVAFADMERLGRNPARLIPAWHEFLAEHRGGSRPVRAIGEPVWPGRTAEELAECQLHERLLNRAFAGTAGWRLLCPYDVGRLGPEVVGVARSTHPWITRHDGGAESPAYADSAVGGLDDPLPPPPASALPLRFGARNAAAVRQRAAELAVGAGLEPDAADDLCLAVHEVATNSVRHGGGTGVMRGWITDDGVVCQVEDAGHIRDPLAGRLPPAPEGLGGRGLWLANRLCDLVQIRSSPAGTVVRLRLGR